MSCVKNYGLLIDSSSTNLYLCLVQQDLEYIAYDTDTDKSLNYTHNLFLEVLLGFIKKNNLTLKDLAFIACGQGPGISNFGIRIGITSSMAISTILNIPYIKFSSMLAAAAPYLFDNKKVAVLLNANRFDFYCGDFSYDTTLHAQEYSIMKSVLNNTAFKRDIILSNEKIHVKTYPVKISLKDLIKFIDFKSLL